MTDNMRIWETLGKTDPKETKQFTRAGGFRGTAIRPMWANRRMTEFFGPCGSGWGQTEPQFQVINADEEIMVYCTVGVWYLQDGERKGPVFGVGGDKVLIKGKEGTRTSDEAFKAAYTDAIGNATKFIGVGADVHMGLFDDNKYVQSMKEEFKDAVEDEVQAQKAGAEPPPIEFLYSNKILICRPINAELRKKGTKEFYAVKLNGKVADKAQLIFCWHKSMWPALAGSVGKLCKLSLDGAGDFFNIEDILEVDGVKWEQPEDTTETQARLLASTMDFTEDDLKQLHSRYCSNSWPVTLEKLQAERVRREALEGSPA